MIMTDARRNNRRNDKDARRKICSSHFIARVRKGLLRVCMWEGVGDRTELKYFDPSLLWPSRCVFLVLLMLNGRPRGSLCWVLASFTTSYQQLLWTPTHQGPKPLRPSVAFPTTSRLQLAATQLARRTQLSYIIVRRPLDLWNRMFNRHQAEITVMQFSGHSLPVHHSVVAQWDLHLVPYYQP